jgi:TPP-dependent pyruvate/acetoin dehydrogenase alpha subunit
MYKIFLKNSFEKASYCRHFEKMVFKNVQKKNINIPVYLSAGQEVISASLAVICKMRRIKPLLFPQHRCHSIYLNFGGNTAKLIDELLGRASGCTNGMGGSASIHSKSIYMFGHDGLMGTQGPIGVGAAYASKKPTIVFLGDASAEEDYVLASIGWASFKKLPILFVVEDNNLSILTEKKVRRHWKMKDIAKGFKMESYDFDDDPKNFFKLANFFFKKPILINVKTNRLFWHSGAGIDSDKIFDRYENLIKNNPIFKKIDSLNKKKIDLIWKRQLEKQ